MAQREITIVWSPYRTHQGITFVGGHDWVWPIDQVIDAIRSNSEAFFIRSGQHCLEVVVSATSKRSYIQAQRDGQATDELLERMAPPRLSSQSARVRRRRP